MGNVVDPNRCPEHVQGVSPAPDILKPNGEEMLMSHPHAGDSLREPVLQPMGRCPMHAILEGLDFWQDLDPDFRRDPPDHA